MTKQPNWMPQSPIEAYATTYESLAKALAGLQNKVEIPETAREFVKRSAAVAKDRSDELYTGASKISGAFEQALVGAASGLADANRKIVDAVHQDAGAAFAAIDKLAGAQSLSDAYAVYIDYLREQTNVGVGRAQAVVSFVSTKTAEGFDTVRNGLAKLVPVRPQGA